MAVAVANRRNQILGECRLLRTDVESRNDRKTPEKLLQMSFDFTIDLEELAQLDEAA
jgi:hypothetical protein